MRVLRLGIGTITVVAVTISGCGQSNPKPTYQKMTIEQAIKAVDFKVKQPTQFPFQVTDTSALIGTLNSHREVMLVYENKAQQKMLVENVTGDTVYAPSDGSETNLKLRNGQDAVYVPYQQLSALMWWDNGESYVLQDKQGPPTSNKTKPFLSANQLLEIANSIK